MSLELSYTQLKTANEARQSEEVRLENRKRNLLVLILHHLVEEGFLDAAQALEKEAGSSLKKYTVCDNVDLLTILQEYESYYQVKFKKLPKLAKKASEDSQVTSTKPPKPRKSAKSEPLLLPHIPGTPPTTRHDGSGTRKSSAGRKKEVSEKKESHSKGSVKDQPVCEDLGLSGVGVQQKRNIGSNPPAKNMIDVRGVIQSAIKDASSDIYPHTEDPHHGDRLLRPIAGFAGYNSEMRDLAAVVAKDIYLQSPNVRWSDIIGLTEAKRLIKEAVVYPIKYPQLFTGILSPWKGLLLYGPPGTGKTMLAKAVATECKTTFFNISASTIVSKWRGDSEKLVRVLFELARFHAPSTIFVDELESIMSQRGASAGPGGEHEGSRRMKTELLVQMDGLSKSSDLVFLLAASNLPWELDHAMLRRLEKRILVDLPNEQARNSMIRHYLPTEVNPPPLQITSCIDYDRIAQLTVGYSGSDVLLLCKEAAMGPVRKVFDKLEELDDDSDGLDHVKLDPILTEDLEEALKRTKPSTGNLSDKYKQWQSQYESV